MGDLKVSDEEISLVIPILQRLVWAGKETRAKIEQAGVIVVPCDYYSNTPSVEEIENSYEYSSAEPPYLNTKIFDERAMLKTLEQIRKYSAEFNPPLEGDEENGKEFFWRNDWFSHADAMSYYCFVRWLKPATIVEIGAGFSTLVALHAIEKNRSGSLHCIDPFPRGFLRNDKRISLHAVKAQAMGSEFLNDTLRDGDILFIDSTHTVKSGSDCVHIYLRLLPEIRRSIFVHVHDVYLPFGLPQEWLLDLQRFWTEQYLLLAFLMDNPRATLLYGSKFNGKRFPERMDALMAGKYPRGGSSVWFRYNGNPGANSPSGRSNPLQGRQPF